MSGHRFKNIYVLEICKTRQVDSFGCFHWDKELRLIVSHNNQLL